MEAWVASILRTEAGGFLMLSIASLIFAVLVLLALTGRNFKRIRELEKERLLRHRAEEVATMLYGATRELRMDTEEDEALRRRMLELSETLVPGLGDQEGLIPPFSQSGRAS